MLHGPVRSSWRLAFALMGAALVMMAAEGPLDTKRAWYENGQLKYERTYRNGREDGVHRGWYDDGSRMFEYHYAAGFSDGLQRQWYRSGQILARFHHRRGQEAGQQQLWNPDGTIRSNYVIRDGKRYGLLGAMGCTGKDIGNGKLEMGNGILN